MQSPLAVAGECLEVLRLAKSILAKFNMNALSDLGVAALEAKAGLEGAVMNVKINLPSIKDQAFAAQTRATVAQYLEEGGSIRTEIYQYVHDNLV